jgi:hypothetical protein
MRIKSSTNRRVAEGSERRSRPAARLSLAIAALGSSALLAGAGAPRPRRRRVA